MSVEMNYIWKLDQDFTDVSTAFIEELKIDQVQKEIDGVKQWDDADETIPTMIDEYDAANWMMLKAIEYIDKIAERGANKLRLRLAPPVKVEIKARLIADNISKLQ